MHTRHADGPEGREAGFTLVEALVAMVVLIFGLLAVSNLMIVAGTSNSVANQSTAAAAQASEVMERLKGISFTALTTGGDLAADAGSVTNCSDAAQDCVVAGNFNAQRVVPGVGPIKTRWQVVAGPDNQVIFIRVRSEGQGTIGRSRTRAEFTMFRTCTSTDLGCPTP